MGWRDGERFEKFLGSVGIDKTTLDENQLALLKKTYEQGYHDGWETSTFYDRRWDAD